MPRRRVVTRPAPAGRGPAGARDVVVTGMGFCLPGYLEPVFTSRDVWSIASRGGSCLMHDDIYYGSVNLSHAMFDERLPDAPPLYSRHYTAAHRYGLVSLVEACADAGLDFRTGALRRAAILVGRGGIEANVGGYLAMLGADPQRTSALRAVELFVAAAQSATPSDVALVQGAVTRATGPCYTVSCGAASCAVQLGAARRLIADGDLDVAVVTGVDLLDINLVRNLQRLLRGSEEVYASIRSAGMPETPPSFHTLMRPYDRRSAWVNHGEGAATLVVESREHAVRRGARLYGRILACALARDGVANPLAADERGGALAAAARRCLGDRWRIEDVRYVNGGGDGNPVLTGCESNAVRQLYGPDTEVLMTSQAACFGHTGAASGCVGVAAALLMMETGEVCPTANCELPAEGLSFDPVPGLRTRPLEFDCALAFDHHTGGVRSAVLLGRAERRRAG